MINGLIDSSDYGLQVCDMDYANYFKRHTFQASDSKKMYNMEVIEAFLIIKWEEFRVLIELITSTDYHWI